MGHARRIDVHHHIIPKIYTAALETAGINTSGGLMMKDWSPEMSLEHMEALGVETAICSISEPALIPFVEADLPMARDLARQLNEYMAGLHKEYPTRFGAFAVLPMPNVEAALEELAYALDVLQLDGVGLLSNYGGQYLGNRVFEPVFEALDKRGACVYIHPSAAPAPAVMPRPEFMPMDYLAEFCFNTTRAAANMIYGGTMERHQNIRPILSHMGGTLPYLSWRLETCKPGEITVAMLKRQNALPDFLYEGWMSATRPVLEYVGRFYYDTALATHRPAFDAVELLAPGHTLFGSDAFYASLETAQKFVAGIEAYCQGDSMRQAAINRANAAPLFPHFSS